jgi:hypothetical protein
MVEAPFASFRIAAYSESEIFEIGCPPEFVDGEILLQAYGVSSAEIVA